MQEGKSERESRGRRDVATTVCDTREETKTNSDGIVGRLQAVKLCYLRAGKWDSFAHLLRRLPRLLTLSSLLQRRGKPRCHARTCRHQRSKYSYFCSLLLLLTPTPTHFPTFVQAFLAPPRMSVAPAFIVPTPFPPLPFAAYCCALLFLAPPLSGRLAGLPPPRTSSLKRTP